jgi:hypothetical protein
MDYFQEGFEYVAHASDKLIRSLHVLALYFFDITMLEISQSTGMLSES